jgi:Ala-tRNA(Pro) deacylase
MKVDELLSSRHIPFERLRHRPAYTANRAAQVLHVPGKQMAKSVLLRTGQGYAVAVLPATHQIDLDQIRQCLADEGVEMATEGDMEQVFPDCEKGAVPPFGSFYHLRTIVEEALAEDEEIVFDAQSHDEAIRMAYRDYEAVEHPLKAHFANRA